MKVLVTGAAGFIGYYVVKRLLIEKGIEVVGIDSVNDYYDVNIKYGRLNECGIDRSFVSSGDLVGSSLHSKYRFGLLDITDTVRLNQLFQDERFDYVINMAAQAGVRYSTENPSAYVQSNIVGFLNILECCRHHQIKHLIYASSSSVYGMRNSIPYKEDDSVDFPVSFYAATKKSNELMAHSYSHLYKLPTTGVRPFTVYGPWGRPDMAPMIFTKAICEGKPIKVYNNGDMLRDFTFVGDIVESIVRLLPIAPTGDEKHPFYRVLNVGNSYAVNLMDFIKIVEKAIGKEAILDMQPMQPGDVKETYADTHLLEGLTSFRPTTDLKDGIALFVDWYKKYYNV